MNKVTIVGAGIAGIGAALRPLERGFHMRLLEQDNGMGGGLRACHLPDDSGGSQPHCAAPRARPRRAAPIQGEVRTTRP